MEAIATIGILGEWLASQSLVEWLIAIGTVSAVVVAVLPEKARRLFHRPRLSFEIDLDSEFCGAEGVAIKDWRDAPASRIRYLEQSYYIRAVVSNTGAAVAKNVRLLLDKIYEWKDDDGVWVRVAFLPRAHVWGFGGDSWARIFPRGRTFVTIAGLHFFDGQAPIDREARPLHPGAALRLRVDAETADRDGWQPPGTYRLVCTLHEKHSEPKSLLIEVRCSGKWCSTWEDCRRTHLDARVVDSDREVREFRDGASVIGCRGVV